MFTGRGSGRESPVQPTWNFSRQSGSELNGRKEIGTENQLKGKRKKDRSCPDVRGAVEAQIGSSNKEGFSTK